MKLLIIGHARHGKDTVSEYFCNNYDMTFKSSSEHLARAVVYPVLKDTYGYTTVQECFEDRHNHRSEWFDLLTDYCSDSPARLGREIFEESDIYCGLRSYREFNAIRNKGLFDFSIWVDRSDHLPPESKDSMTLEPWMADFVIDNNGDIDDLERRVHALYVHMLGLLSGGQSHKASSFRLGL